MNRFALLLASLVLATAAQAQSDDTTPLFEIGGHKINGYLGTAIRISSVFSQAAGFADVKAAAVVDGSWGIGLMGSGLYYDKKLSALTPDGTYHLYAGYGGLFVEKYFPLGDRVKLSVSIMSGVGEAYYQYDKQYRKGKLWYEETIDKATFYVLEPGMGIDFRVSNTIWLGVTGSYRSTSPLSMVGTDDNLLQKLNGGVSLKWGVF